MLLVQLAPRIEGLLRLLEDVFKALRGIQPFVQVLGVALIGNGKLILQIHKTVIDRRGGEHQDFRLDAGADNLFHQLLIAVLLRVAVRADTVAEVMGFVNDDQVIVAPVETV